MAARRSCSPTTWRSTPTSPLMAAACRPATYWRRFPERDDRWFRRCRPRSRHLARGRWCTTGCQRLVEQPAAGAGGQRYVGLPRRRTDFLRSGGDLSLGQGSLLDVSSGAALLADGKRLGGRGGDIALHASAGLAQASDGQLQLGGTLNGLGTSGAGTLSLQSGKVRIGGDDLGDGSLQLAEDFFQQGFASYRVVGRSGLTVAEDAQVRVARPVLPFRQRGRRGRGWRGAARGAGGLDTAAVPRGCLGRTLGPTRRGGPVPAGRRRRQYPRQLDPASQTLELGRGSLVEVDPGRAIVLRGPGQITLMAL